MSYLDKIVLRKQVELNERPRRSQLTEVLKTNAFTVIAEIKRGSPSKGLLATIDNPEQLAEQYLEAGAGAVSVLTDQEFHACLHDLKRVAQSIASAPIIRKDFVIDPIQIAEAAVAGASTVLLIVKVLGARTKEMIHIASLFGLDTLVEVHDEEELNVALEAGASIIGVNNRNLTTFTTDISVSERLAKMIPKDVLKVSESGIHTRGDINRLKTCGYDAVLIGESIVTAPCPKEKIKELIG